MNSTRASIKRLEIQLAAGAVVAALSVACGGASTTAPPTTPVTLHGEVSDPIRDVVPVAGVSNPPDLIRGTVEVSGGNITFTIQFAPGTFDRQTTGVGIELDTDRNPSTGIPGANGVGIDYHVSLWAPTNQVLIEKAVPPSTYTGVGTAPLTVVADGVQATIPLSVLGNADGRVNFRVFAYYAPPGGTTVLTDVIPDVTLPPGSVQ